MLHVCLKFIFFIKISYFSYLGIFCIIFTKSMQLLFTGILKEGSDMDKSINDAEQIAEQKELHKIKKCLLQADQSCYHRIIQHHKRHGKTLPHYRDHVHLFLNTFQYINIFSRNRG